ncbi:MAG: OmpA family protein [Myxococcales bacterium]|nr:OmpA family protein [Myxococcales bacterium]
MSNPRRVAWLLVAAQVGIAAFVVADPAQAQQRAPQTSNDDEEDEEDEPPAGTGSNASQSSGTNSAAQSGASTPTAPTTPAATTNRPRTHADFPGADETEEDREARRDRMIHRFGSLSGAIGLMHMQTAEGGSEQTFRFGLMAEYFGANGFLRPTGNANFPLPTGFSPEDSSRIGATLTASYSPLRYLEVFAALRSFAVSNSNETPRLFQVLGDTQLGAKGIFPITRGLTLGATASVLILNRAGGIGVNGEGTSADFRLLGTFDLSQVTPAPIRIHLNVGYTLDNSAQLVRETELARQRNTAGYNAMDCANPSTDSTSRWARNPACHVEVTRGERYALGINRADRLRVAIGVDAKLETSVVGFAPFVEWNAPIPIIRNGYICWQPTRDVPSAVPGDDDRCFNEFSSIDTMPSTLTLGTRVWTPYARGLGAILAVDIGTTGTSTFVRELAPNTPWMFYFGLGFAHDFNPRTRRVPVERVVDRVVERDNTPVGGEIVGAITDAESHRPIANATVEVVGHPDFGIFATNAQGQFRSRRVAPAEYEIRVRAPEYTDNTCRGTVPAPTGDSRNSPETTINCELRIIARRGIVAGRVTAEGGAAVAGVTVTLTPAAGITVPQGETAPAPVTAQTGADGAFRFENVLAGGWTVRVDQGATTRGSAPRNIDVRARETAAADVQVAASDIRGFRIQGRQVTVPDQVHFVTDSADIMPDSQTLLERIADFLNRHPELRSVEIQGHTDNQGPRPRNQALSQQRAESVRTALVNLGVAADRLTARGFGPDRPIGPNLTPAGRARNRRVVFEIKQRGR